MANNPVRSISYVKMDRNENVRECIDRVKRLKNACVTPPNEPYLITWFISRLKLSIKREMKKARRYITFVQAMKATMDVEDEGVGSYEATTYEPITLANSFTLIQVEDYNGPKEGQ